MKLNDEILAALKRAIKHYGNTSQFADHIGVAHSTVLFWLSGKTSNISGKIWTGSLRRELRSFMKEPQDDRLMVREDTVTFSDLRANTGRDIAMAKYSAMKDFDSTVESPVSFVREHAVSSSTFTNGKMDSFFALELDEDAAGSVLPKGTKLLLSGFDYAQDGDIVICKRRNPSELVIGRYQKIKSMIRLTPLDTKRPSVEWLAAENPEKIFWMYPVEEIIIDLLKKRWTETGLENRE